MKKIFAALSVSSLLAVLTPAIASAQQLSSLNNINDVSNRFVSILHLVTVLVVAVAVLWIIINVVRFLVASGDAEKRKAGLMQIIWGIVGLFIIGAIWGLVSILSNSFATNNTSSQDINNVQVQNVPQVQ